MTKWAAALWLLGAGFFAHAQSSAPATTALTPPPATAPAAPIPTTKPDNARYLAEPALLARCQAELNAFNDQPCDLIFIGGSLTAGWRGPGKAIWDRDYAPRKALNFSIEGDTTQNVLWRLTNLDLASLHPKVAVLMIGQGNSENTVHEIADGIREVIINTQVAFPNVKIILMSIVPNDLEHEKMMQVNSIIRSYADDMNVFFVNLVPLMPAIDTTNPDGTATTNFKGIGPDHIMPDATGYQIWAEAIDPLLAKLLK